MHIGKIRLRDWAVHSYKFGSLCEFISHLKAQMVQSAALHADSSIKGVVIYILFLIFCFFNKA